MGPEGSVVEGVSLAILKRVLEARAPSFTPEAARALLALQFDQVDLDRMNVLAEKNRDGELSEVEWQELQQYLLIGHLLDLLHAKARLTLKPAAL